MFESQLGKNIEMYIDDMVVKSKVESEHIDDLGNIFEILRKHKLLLNTTKYSFGIGFGKFLGYMVTDANLNRHTLRPNKNIGICCEPQSTRFETQQKYWNIFPRKLKFKF